MHTWPPHNPAYNTRLHQAAKQKTPYCQQCGSLNNLEADHIIPLAEGGTNHLTNLQVLCHTCHQQKTQAEAARGTQRRQARLRKPTTPHPAYPKGGG